MGRGGAGRGLWWWVVGRGSFGRGSNWARSNWSRVPRVLAGVGCYNCFDHDNRNRFQVWLGW